MAKIILNTQIEAPIERVFDLSRSIDLHMASTSATNEKAIAGRTSGLIELNETVTWRAKHFGIYQKLTVQITEFKRPTLFVDVMLKGAFATMRHKHSFKEHESGTIMTDEFEFKSPLGFLGTIADALFLKSYLLKFLELRNQEIKEVAESDRWKNVLQEQ